MSCRLAHKVVPRKKLLEKKKKKKKKKKKEKMEKKRKKDKEKQTRMIASVLKPDPNTRKVQKNAIRTKRNVRIFGIIPFMKVQNDTLTRVKR